MTTPSVETRPPTSHKFYVRSGELNVVLASDAGPLGAAMKFVVRAFQGGNMSQLGNHIEVSESGRFTPGNVILRWETCHFLLDNLGVNDAWITHVLARELHTKSE